MSCYLIGIAMFVPVIVGLFLGGVRVIGFRDTSIVFVVTPLVYGYILMAAYFLNGCVWSWR